MDLQTEIKRKIFHHLSLIYLLIYWISPRWFSVPFLFFILLVFSGIEFIRLRRPEINARLLQKFGGIHRVSEITHPSGIFWTLLGCWSTMLIFTERAIVIPALGFLVFGDTVAALAGQKWGKRRWDKNPAKTKEGSAAFAGASCLWALFFVRWPVAILSSLWGAWVESRPLPYNDNLWVPLLSGLGLSIFNLLLGRHR